MTTTDDPTTPARGGAPELALPEVERPEPAVDALLQRLAVAHIGDTFNQYAEVGEGPARLDRLRRYLTPRWANADVVLVGEAAGYRGCRLSGIAFTSVRQLGVGTVSELSASVVHRALASFGLEDEVILWNAVPTHPQAGDDPMTNRSPRRHEVELGAGFLKTVIDGRRAVAVGRVAERRLGPGCDAVRHPARGGAVLFTEGLRRLFGLEEHA